MTSLTITITITINEDLLRRARIRALEPGTSTNRLLQEYLEAFATDHAVPEGTQEVLAIAGSSTSGSGPEGRAWSREELFQR